MNRIQKKIFNEFNFFVILIVFWSYYFLNSTIKLEDGKESVLLIKPLFYLLVTTSIFVILETFIKGLKTSGELFEKKKNLFFNFSFNIFFSNKLLWLYFICLFILCNS